MTHQHANQPYPDDRSIQDYAAGLTAWEHLSDKGFRYIDVLQGIGRLGLEVPPIVLSAEEQKGMHDFMAIALPTRG